MLTYDMPYSADALVRLFSNLEEYAKVHPLILTAEQLEIEPLRYKIIERPYKFLPIKISYVATVNTRGKEIEYDISTIPLTKLKIKYNFSDSSSTTTTIDCMIQLDSKLVGKGILLSKLEKAQNDLMKSLDQYYLK